MPKVITWCISCYHAVFACRGDNTDVFILGFDPA